MEQLTGALFLLLLLQFLLLLLLQLLLLLLPTECQQAGQRFGRRSENVGRIQPCRARQDVAASAHIWHIEIVHWQLRVPGVLQRRHGQLDGKRCADKDEHMCRGEPVFGPFELVKGMGMVALVKEERLRHDGVAAVGARRDCGGATAAAVALVVDDLVGCERL